MRGILEKPQTLVRDVFEALLKKHLFWDILNMFQRFHTKDVFFEMFLRRLKNVIKKSFLLRCFKEFSEMSLLMKIWLRSLRDISCRLGYVCQILNLLKGPFYILGKKFVSFLFKCTFLLFTLEAVAQRCSVKRVFL